MQEPRISLTLTINEVTLIQAALYISYINNFNKLEEMKNEPLLFEPTQVLVAHLDRVESLMAAIRNGVEYVKHEGTGE